ncbi:MAG TPA: SagB/ThcOx family dehydrogenase, partial [Verrucomicrobiota bacterium]|nr:SagB/ThcOx family dehydrogenase [Verrucomicrobiota bacterium]
MRTIGWLSLCCLALSSAGFAGDGAPLVLPAPEIHSGKPLMQALKERRTTRELTPGPVSLQELGNLLWAAFGIN